MSVLLEGRRRLAPPAVHRVICWILDRGVNIHDKTALGPEDLADAKRVSASGWRQTNQRSVQSIIGFAYNKIGEHGLLALYVLCQFFFNFGLNTTTSIVPGKCFPTRYRSTSHGLSAVSVKNAKGAAASPWLDHVMEIFTLFMLCGVFTTLLIPETKQKTLVELAGEVPGTANYNPVTAGHTGRKAGYAKENSSCNGTDGFRETNEKSVV